MTTEPDEGPEGVKFVLHPFQAVDILIRPKGWFSRLFWRWFDYELDWGLLNVPRFEVRKEGDDD